MKIYNTNLSLKKINGKSSIALDWSKNNTDNKKKYFNTHIMIINLKTQQWWKKSPNIKSNNNKFTIYNDSRVYTDDNKINTLKTNAYILLYEKIGSSAPGIIPITGSTSSSVPLPINPIFTTIELTEIQTLITNKTLNLKRQTHITNKSYLTNINHLNKTK